MRHYVTLAAITVLLLISVSAFGQDLTATPSFGELNLEMGFESPMELTNAALAGGEVDANALLSAEGIPCAGRITDAPSFRINWTGDGALKIAATPNDGISDLTLVISDATGNWICNDDYDGLNPGVELEGATSGTYNIWVGFYSWTNDGSDQTFPPATLTVESHGEAALETVEP